MKSLVRSELEAALIFQLKATGLPEPVQEFPFSAPLGRKHRADLAWPDHMLLLEVQGGGFVEGRHTRGVGLERDCEKMSLAAILGYRYLQVTGAQIGRGEALEWIRRAIGGQGG